jgi:phosphatidylglycerol:prolipoprotein diacylglycerol transferase
MDSAGEVLIFILLLVIRRYRRFDGQLIASYLIMYAVMRYVLEFFRGDAQRGFIVEPWLSTSQFVSLLIFAAGLFMYMRFRRGARKD